MKQLCATGTVGAAAIGLAFGRPQDPLASRPTSNKRKALARASIDVLQQASTDAPVTPSPRPQTRSATTSRLRKRSVNGQSSLPPSKRNDGRLAAVSIPNLRSSEGGKGFEAASLRNPRPSTSHDPMALNERGTSPNKSSWLRRLSTLSSSRNGSPVSTPRPGSPSVSYSNGSTAPMLRSSEDFGTTMLPRNKLVKRSSSQRVLTEKSLSSTLRRPATSHQRSATLQQQYFRDEASAYRSSVHSSLPLNEVLEDEQMGFDSSQVWYPYFEPRLVKAGKDGGTLKRHSTGVTKRYDLWKNVRPVVDDLPTLLDATHITPSFPEGMTDGLPRPPGAFRSFTPPASEKFDNSTLARSRTHDSPETDPKPRQSFSLSEMFPSPSPSTWKVLRTSSLKKQNSPRTNAPGRRITSAPQPSHVRRVTNSPGAADGFGNHTRIWSPEPIRRHTSDSHVKANGEIPSSPLPPLNRLSTFEIDLPGTAPSYPSSPQPTIPRTSPRPFSPPSPSISPPQEINMNRIRINRPSGAFSEDRTSTLWGSDFDNSRFTMSGDEDEADGRSDTVYDSTRTGATGSSHSGVRKPGIETIFDESPPPDEEEKISPALPKSSSTERGVPVASQTKSITDQERNGIIPVQATGSRQEVTNHLLQHDAENPASNPARFASPPAVASNTKMPQPTIGDVPIDDAKELRDSKKLTPAALQDPHGHGWASEGSSSDQSDIFNGSDSPPTWAINPYAERPSKDNIFEWSEQLPQTRDPQGSSTRPKTANGKQGISGRRGSSALHFRSQSVPMPQDNSGHRTQHTTAQLESWVLGGKGPSEEWDNDFDFDEPVDASPQEDAPLEPKRTSSSSGMLVPRSIMDRQATVHGQFGQVKELTLLVDELKRLRQLADAQGIVHGPSVELWKEAEGIINLATLDEEEQEFLPPRSPHSPGSDSDFFGDDSPSTYGKRKPNSNSLAPTRETPRESRMSSVDEVSSSQPPSRSSPDKTSSETPPKSSPRTESSVRAKFVVDNINQQRSFSSPSLAEAKAASRKEYFDTTSLRDLVTRAGVVTRALKEILRRAESSDNAPADPASPPAPPEDPPFSHMFHDPSRPEAPNTPSSSPRNPPSLEAGHVSSLTYAISPSYSLL